jgi:tetratricopeptide (TPR) repeat protein
MSETSVGAIRALTDDEIEARVGSQSFQRGKQYFRDGAIFDARQHGTTLRARSHGSQGGPYRLRATFAFGGISAANCSCPVGDGGYCKHIAALLLTWRERPEAFLEVEELDTTLEQRSKEELIALVKQMLIQEPELESLLEVPLPVAGKRSTPADPAIYRRQAAGVFFPSRFEWGAPLEDVENGLSAIMSIGQGFARQQDHTGAAAVYEAVALESLKHFEEYSGGESRPLDEIIMECAGALGECLAHEEDQATRERLLHTLFEIYRFDVDSGGFGLGEEVPDIVLENATSEELGVVAGWVREAIPQGDDWNSNRHRQIYGGFLLDLEPGITGLTVDDEAFLRICRETGRVYDLVDRLMSLGYVEEAVQAAEQAGDYDLLRLAGIFDQHERGDLAQQLILRRSETTEDTRIFVWLKDRYRFQGDSAAALELAEKLFRDNPDLEQYRELRELAQKTDQSRSQASWEVMRPQVLSFLREQSWDDLLIAIFLDEGEIDQALETLRAPGSHLMRFSYHLYGEESLAMQVARAAARTRPRDAIEIYERQVERFIAGRNRAGYREAAHLLTEMQEAYEDMGESEAWPGYIEELRRRYKSLRALKEELAAEGL